MPLISAVIPVYQVLNYLTATVNSVRAQTFTDWELILVDDGSTDGSAALCDSLAASDPRISVIHQENRGQGPARNTGFDSASGTFVFYLDSDDTIASNTFEMFSKLIDEHPELDIVFFGFRMVSTTPPQAPYTRSYSSIVFSNTREAQHAFLTRRCRFLTPNTFYRRSWLSANNLRFRAVPYSEDIFNLWECLLTRGNFAYIDAPVYNYLSRPGSIMTGSKLQKIVDGLPHFLELEKRIETSPSAGESTKRYMLARWILGILHSGARLCNRQEFQQLAATLDARSAMRRLADFPDLKARILARLYLLSPRLFHTLCRRL